MAEPLPLHREGNREGRTLFFVHGWPDDERIWAPQVAAFRDRHHCVRVTLPGYGAEDGEPRGLDFPDLAARIAATVEALCEERSEPGVVLIGHDWGAYLSYFVERLIPERIERMITLDVGGHIQATDPKQVALIAAYQLPLLAAWSVRRAAPRLADGLTRAVARAVRAPLEQRAEPLRARMNYPYYYFWRALTVHREALLRRYEPQCPLLYAYATRKPMMFHSPRWIAMLEGRPGCEVVAIDGTHWLTLSRTDDVNRAIARFVEERA